MEVRVWLGSDLGVKGDFNDVCLTKNVEMITRKC